MTWENIDYDSQLLVTLLSALVLGGSLTMLIDAEPVALPAVGVVPSLVVGGMGIVAFALIYPGAMDVFDVSTECGDGCGCCN